MSISKMVTFVSQVTLGVARISIESLPREGLKVGSLYAFFSIAVLAICCSCQIAIIESHSVSATPARLAKFQPVARYCRDNCRRSQGFEHVQNLTAAARRSQGLRTPPSREKSHAVELRVRLTETASNRKKKPHSVSPP